MLALLVLLAATPPLEVTKGPGTEGCSDTAALQAAVSDRLRHSADVSGDITRFAIRFGATATGFEASVERLDVAGERVGVRRLVASDCEALSEAVALTVSMALANPNARVVDPPVQASSLTTSHAAAGPAKNVRYQVAEKQVASPHESFAPTVPQKLSLSVSAGGGVAVSAIPRTTATAGLSLILGGAHWSVAGGAQGLMPTNAAMGGGTVRSWLVAGDVAACGHYLWFAACGGVLAGAFTSQGRGLDNARTVTTPWVAVTPGVAVQTSFFHALALRARADLLIPLTQTTVHVGDTATWTSAPIGGAFGLDLVADIL